MADSKQTKCPHCGSVFRVSETQMAAKGGMVRCGACLQVFRADHNMVGGNAVVAPAAPAISATAPQKTKPKADPKDESWAIDLLGEEGGALGAKDDGALRVSTSVKPIDDALNFGSPAEDSWKEDQLASNNTKISLGSSELSDFMTETEPARSVASDKPKPSLMLDDDMDIQPLGSLAPLEDFAAAPAGFASVTETAVSNADEAWAQDILKELEAEEKKASAKNYSMEIVREKAAPPKEMAPTISPTRLATPAAPEKQDFAFGDEAALDFLNDEDFGAGLDPVRDLGEFTLAPPPLSEVHEPVVIAAKPSRNWERTLLWSGLNILAIALLIAQYAHFNVDSLSEKPALRPALSALCNISGCQLPTAAQAAIRLDHLLVRTDSDRSALLVDTLMHNRSGAAMAFPALRLTLRDAEDKVIGSRLFMPQEYLEGEAKSLKELAPDTPVHISLELQDPGPVAVGYSMTPEL